MTPAGPLKLISLALLRLVGSFLLWTFWLALAALLVLQIYLATSPQLNVPHVLLRPWEDRLAFAGLRATFDRVRFDPSGGISVEKLEIVSLTSGESLGTVDSLFLEIDPWLLAAGKFEPRSVQVNGLNLFAPAMFSASGVRERIIGQVAFSASIAPERIELHHFSGRAGRLALVARGALTPPAAPPPGNEQLRERVAAALRTYYAVSRALTAYEPELAAVDDPCLELILTPSPTRVATVQAEFTAGQAHLDPQRFKAAPSWKERIELSGIRARTTIGLAYAGALAARLDLDIRRASTAPIGLAEDFRAVLHATFPGNGAPPEVRECVVTCDRFTGAGLRVEALGANLKPRLPQAVDGSIHFSIGDATWSLAGRADLQKRTATLQGEGSVTPALLEVIGRHFNRDLRPLLAPAAPPHLRAEVSLGEGWKLTEARAVVRCGPVVARNVAVDRATGRLRFAGQRLEIEDITLLQGSSHCEGSYVMDTVTRDYRFLLTGKIQPDGIAGWFSAWWPRFWRNFDFSAGGPLADVDVRGRWGSPHLSTVFVQADCSHPVIRDVKFDRVYTALFIRPDFYDALDLLVLRDGGAARGTFTRRVDLRKDAFHSMDFNVVSTIDVQEGGRLFGASGLEIVTPFQFEKPPLLRIAGHLDGPAAPGGAHERADVQIESTGGLSFYGFPLNNLQARARLEGDRLSIEQIDVGVASGKATGRAERTGKTGQRRLSFDLDVRDVNLGLAIQTGEAFAARRKGLPPAPQSRFQQRLAAGKLQLKLNASGPYDNPFGYEGQGSAEITGAELADIHLLGALSQALRGLGMNFTTIRLDTARSRFQVAKDRLVFDDVRLHGPTAAVEAKGYYRLDAKTMNFAVTVRPFEEGKTLLANAMDLVLTPLSAALQLRLTGQLEDPKWWFSYGPTSFFRKLSGNEDPEKSEPESAPRTKEPPRPPRPPSR